MAQSQGTRLPTDHPNHRAEEAYLRLFQYCLLHHATISNPAWLNCIQNGRWPTRQGDMSIAQLQEIGIRIGNILGARVGTRMGTRSIYKNIMNCLHPDKMFRSRRSGLFGSTPPEEVNFRHYACAEFLRQFCTQALDIGVNDVDAEASSNHSLPIPAYTSGYDPIVMNGYSKGQQVTPFDALATRDYRDVLSSMQTDTSPPLLNQTLVMLGNALDAGVIEYCADKYRCIGGDVVHQVFEEWAGGYYDPFTGMVVGRFAKTRYGTFLYKYGEGPSENISLANDDDDEAEENEENEHEGTGDNSNHNDSARSGDENATESEGTARGSESNTRGDENNRGENGGQDNNSNSNPGDNGGGDTQTNQSSTPNDRNGGVKPLGIFDRPPTDEERDGSKECRPTRPRASAMEMSRDPYAVVDHLSFMHCYGCEGASFQESETIPPYCQHMWATSFGIVCDRVTDTLTLMHNEYGNPPSFELKLERAIKMFFLFPTLILRKPPGSDNSIKLPQLIKRRLNEFRYGEWDKLVGDFEADIVKIATSDKSEFGSKRSVEDISYEKATKLIRSAQLGRAKQAILSTGCSDPTTPHIKDQMSAKFVDRKVDIPDPTREQYDTERATLDYDIFRETIRKLSPQTSPGLGCLRNEHLTALLYNERSNAPPSAKTAFESLHRVMNEVVTGQMPWYFYKAWTATSLSAVNKMDPKDLKEGELMDCRPVAKGYTLRKAVTKALFQPLKDTIIEETSPTQFGSGEPAGGTKMIFANKLHSEANPDHVTIVVDVKNAFNEIERASVLKEYWDRTSIRSVYNYEYKCLAIENYIGLGSNERMESADRTARNGVHQGAVDSSPSYNLAVDKPNRLTHAILCESEGLCNGGIDDTTIKGPMEEAFQQLREHEERLKSVGLVLNRSKTRCYIAPEYRTARYHELRGDIKEGGYIDPETKEITHYGVTIYGIPFGDTDYIEEFLRRKGDKMVKDMKTVADRMDPASIGSPEVPSKQCLWQLTLRCLQFRGNYICRHLPPSLTKDFCRRLDTEINKLIELSTGIDLEEDGVSAFTRERARLPIKSKGLGVRSLESRRYAEFLGGAVQGITTLIDRTDENGMVQKGRFNSATFKEWLGEHSFDAESLNPWETLLSQDSAIGQGIKDTWVHLQGEYEKDVQLVGETVDPTSIMANPSGRAGFSTDGKMLKGSVTRIVSEALESAKIKVLDYTVKNSGDGSLYNPTQRERLIYSNCDSFSSQFVAALLCPIGIMTDRVFVEAMAMFMAQPSPAMKPFTHIPHFIGREKKEQEVDPYGDVVARAEVNGGDFIRSHEQLKILWNGILRKAGFDTTMEARNIFHDAVPWEYVNEYIRDQHSKDAIIPDILVHNYPPDNNSNGNAVVPAIFDIKTVRVDKRGDRYKAGVPGSGRQVDRAVKKIATACRSAYLRKAGKLDDKFATGDASRPFTTAIQHTFATGNAIPLVSGAVGELNLEGHRLVELAARHAAARADNSDITPESVTSVKGSPYNLLLNQFRRAIGCMASRVAMEEKLRRLPLIRQSRVEANRAADCGMGNHRRKSNRRAPGWYQNFRNENIYDAFYRYRTHYDHFPSEYGNSPEF